MPHKLHFYTIRRVVKHNTSNWSDFYFVESRLQVYTIPGKRIAQHQELVLFLFCGVKIASLHHSKEEQRTTSTQIASLHHSREEDSTPPGTGLILFFWVPIASLHCLRGEESTMPHGCKLTPFEGVLSTMPAFDLNFILWSPDYKYTPFLGRGKHNAEREQCNTNCQYISIEAV